MRLVMLGEQVGRRLSQLSVGGGARGIPSVIAHTLPGTLPRGLAIAAGGGAAWDDCDGPTQARRIARGGRPFGP